MFFASSVRVCAFYIYVMETIKDYDKSLWYEWMKWNV